jgi:hypothetical protein
MQHAVNMYNNKGRDVFYVVRIYPLLGCSRPSNGLALVEKFYTSQIVLTGRDLED